MRKPFDGEYPLTQAFNDPCCRDAYAKFGLQGHNGQDYGMPTGTKVVAPHGGKVIEATLDPRGYGLYLKIENNIEGSVLAHLKEFRVGIGDTVLEGQMVAYSNNSGNSTGPHLHWGYYRLPRNRQNGFAGFIDQAPFLTTIVASELDTCMKQNDALQKQVEEEITKKNETYEELVQVRTERDGLIEADKAHKIGLEGLAKQLACSPTIPDIASAVGALVSQEDLSISLKEITKDRDRWKQSYEDLEKTVEPLVKELSEMRQEIQHLGEVEDELQKYQDAKGLKVVFSVFGVYICSK